MVAVQKCPYSQEQLRRIVYLAVFHFDWAYGEDDVVAIEDKVLLSDLVHVDDILIFFPGTLRLNHKFQFTTEDWIKWLGLGDLACLNNPKHIRHWLARYRRGEITTTVGELIDFLALRAEAIEFEPVALLGRKCEAAGVMLGLERLYREVASQSTRIGPSSTITESLSSWNLEWFWKRLRVLLGDRVPPLPSLIDFDDLPQQPPARLQRAERIAGPLTLLCLPAIVIVSFLVCWKVFPIAEAIWKPLGPVTIGASMLLMVASSWLLYDVLCRWFGYVPPLNPWPRPTPPASQPLPAGIDTFRDLAKWIVEHPQTSNTAG